MTAEMSEAHHAESPSRAGNVLAFPTAHIGRPLLRVAEPTFLTMSDADWAAVVDLLTEMLVPVVRRRRQDRPAA